MRGLFKSMRTTYLCALSIFFLNITIFTNAFLYFILYKWLIMNKIKSKFAYYVCFLRNYDDLNIDITIAWTSGCFSFVKYISKKGNFTLWTKIIISEQLNNHFRDFRHYLTEIRISNDFLEKKIFEIYIWITNIFFVEDENGC